jgi:hypothetical protein
MDTLSPFNAADYLHRFANAVVHQNDYVIVELYNENSMWFELYLLNGVTFNFHAVDDEGTIGMIFDFDRIIPQAVAKKDIRVDHSQLFDDFSITETVDDRTLLILHVDDDARVGITAYGHDMQLIRVAWPL